MCRSTSSASRRPARWSGARWPTACTISTPTTTSPTTRSQLLNTQTEFAGSYVPTDHQSIHPALDAWQPWQIMTVNAPMIQVSAVTRHGQIDLFGIESYGRLDRRHQNVANGADTGVAANWSDWT